MQTAKLALFLVLGLTAVPIVQAQIQHMEMRVEGMT